MNFSIVTTSLNNSEWLDLFLFSLDKTLHKRDRKILIYDQGDNPQQVEFLKIKYSHLNIDLIQDQYVLGTSYTVAWKRALSLAEGNVCFCHADVCFLMKDWDKRIEDLGDTFSLIASSIRNLIKSYFIVCDKFLILNTDLGFQVPPGKTKRCEHDGIFLKNEESGRSLLLNGSSAGDRFGEIFLLDGKNCFYHNLYSSRSKKNSSCPIPEKEKLLWSKKIINNNYKALIIKEMLENESIDFSILEKLLINFSSRKLI
jgi:hypothetical protein